VGNLFSVAQACRSAAMVPVITAEAAAIRACDAVILPGVGAFGGAMQQLERLGLVSLLQEWAGMGRPLFGICLGIQLLMSESREYGRHRGLGLISGDVVHLRELGGRQPLRVPHVGWNTIHAVDPARQAAADFPALVEGRSYYFVHSYVVVPDNPAVSVTWTEYDGIRFTSSLRAGSVFACQFHPERSGEAGAQLYNDFACSAMQHRKLHHD
jgi:glutamine amidotransferase